MGFIWVCQWGTQNVDGEPTYFFFMFATKIWPSWCTENLNKMFFCPPRPRFLPWQKETPVYPHPGRRPTA